MAAGTDLSALLRAVASATPGQTSEAVPAAVVAVAGMPSDWPVAELADLLRGGDEAALLAWFGQLGQAARREGLDPARASARLTGAALAAARAVARLAGRAGADDATAATVGEPLLAAGLAGYLAAEAGQPAPAGGDLAGRLARLEALYRINRAANSSLHLTAMLDLVVEAVAAVIGSDTCSIWTFDDESDELLLRAAIGLNPGAIGKERLRLGEAITGEAALTRQAIAARDARAHAAYKYIATLGEDQYRSQVSVPILRHSVDRLVGVMTLKTVDYHQWDDDEIRFLKTVAGELAIAIENAQLYHQTDARLRVKVRELATLQRLSARMAETLDLGEVLEIIAVNAAQLGKTQRVSIFRFDAETGAFDLMASQGEEGELPQDRAQAQQELMREVVARAAPRRAGPPGGRVGLTPAQRPAAKAERFSLFGMPLRTARGVLGGICLHYPGDGGPTDEQYGLLVSFANAAAIAIENARLFTDAQRNLVIKTELLREMHHRVRNNLQILAGLLRIQARRAGEDGVVLLESANRIHSIAVVHDLLSREDLGATTLDQVARRVVEETCASLTPPGSRFRTHVDGHGVKVESRQATILGLLVNELVTNALRHGFRECAEGDIWITARVEGGQVVVVIDDNGRGLPDDFSVTDATGLGIHIIRNLVQTDLKGTLTMGPRPGGGTRIGVRFPFRSRGQGGPAPDWETRLDGAAVASGRGKTVQSRG